MLQNRWKKDYNLPLNWFYRWTSKKTFFVDAAGIIYESREAALKSLTEESDILKLKEFRANELLANLNKNSLRNKTY